MSNFINKLCENYLYARPEFKEIRKQLTLFQKLMLVFGGLKYKNIFEAKLPFFSVDPEHFVKKYILVESGIFYRLNRVI